MKIPEETRTARISKFPSKLERHVYNKSALHKT